MHLNHLHKTSWQTVGYLNENCIIDKSRVNAKFSEYDYQVNEDSFSSFDIHSEIQGGGSAIKS